MDDQLLPGVSFNILALGRVMQAVGLALLFLPINALAFRDIPKDRTNYASALINLARNFGGSIGISVASTLVTRASSFTRAASSSTCSPSIPPKQLHHPAQSCRGNRQSDQESLARVGSAGH